MNLKKLADAFRMIVGKMRVIIVDSLTESDFLFIKKSGADIDKLEPGFYITINNYKTYRQVLNYLQKRKLKFEEVKVKK